MGLTDVALDSVQPSGRAPVAPPEEQPAAASAPASAPARPIDVAMLAAANTVPPNPPAKGPDQPATGAPGGAPTPGGKRYQWVGPDGKVAMDVGPDDQRKFDAEHAAQAAKAAAAPIYALAEKEPSPHLRNEIVKTAQFVEAQMLGGKFKSPLDALNYYLSERNDLEASRMNAEGKKALAGASLRMQEARLGEGSRGHDSEEERIISGEFDRTVKRFHIADDIAEWQKLAEMQKGVTGNGIQQAGVRNAIATSMQKGVLSNQDFSNTVLGKAGMMGELESWLEGKNTGRLGKMDQNVLAGALRQAIRNANGRLYRAQGSAQTLFRKYLADPKFADRARYTGPRLYETTFGQLPGYVPFDPNAVPAASTPTSRDRGRKAASTGGLPPTAHPQLKIVGATVKGAPGESTETTVERARKLREEVERANTGRR